MFGRETATAFDNGKRNRIVHTEQLKSELRAVVIGVIDSNLEPHEIHDLFSAAGCPIPQTVVSFFIRTRCEKQNAER